MAACSGRLLGRAALLASLSMGPPALIRTSFCLARLGCACIEDGQMMLLSQLRPVHTPLTLTSPVL